MSENDPLFWHAAKAVAEQRQHGCHYAEGACSECVGIAEAVLRSIIDRQPSDAVIDAMAHASFAAAYRPGLKFDEVASSMRHEAQAAYRAMPVWRVLWAYESDEKAT